MGVRNLSQSKTLMLQKQYSSHGQERDLLQVSAVIFSTKQQFYFANKVCFNTAFWGYLKYRVSYGACLLSGLYVAAHMTTSPMKHFHFILLGAEADTYY